MTVEGRDPQSRRSGRWPARSVAAAALIATAAMTGCGQPQPHRVDGSGSLVLMNAAVFTVNDKAPWADAVAVRNGRIIAVGTNDEAIQAAGAGARTVDLDGKLVMPGIEDAHVHVLEAGVNLRACFLPPGQSVAKYERLARRCAAEQPDSRWVQMAGASIHELRSKGERLRKALDRAVPDRPALVLDDVGHGAWVNSLALEAAGIKPGDADPPGGSYDRDPHSGRFTGVLLENAQHRVRDAAGRPTRSNRERDYDGLLRGIRRLNKAGVTSVSDAGGYWSQGHDDAWRRALQEGKLTVRASNALYVFPDVPFERQMRELKRRFSDRPGSRLRFNQAKIYVDGILDLGTAALLRPYGRQVGAEDPLGFLYFRPAVLNRYVRELQAAGFQAHFHAVGDRAVRLALDAVEAASGTTSTPPRHRITHTYLVDPADRGRFAKLGVFADFQMAPDAIAPAYEREMRPSLGRKRARSLIPTGPVLRAGADVVLSSDWDADPLTPFQTLADAVSRGDRSVPDLATAVKLMTLEPAKLLGQDNSTGSIEVGKLADLIVVDRNIFRLPTNEIGKAKVDVTLLEGEEVYRRR